MTNEETIFAAALDKCSVPERDAYVAQACAGDPQLRQAVNALLQAHQRAGGILEAPPFDHAATVPTHPSQAIGSTIGRYKLLEQIGGGGMGVVYMAEQLNPVRRKVALKIIKLGMDSRQVIARFEAERQALTMMDHPNIAKVLDAGTTDAGRPYFVMELVKGIPITEYCDAARLDTRQRLELFNSVCHAVQHAHQKGIIHRDLKPSNVLVTLHDDKPVAKVIDFGIAKATGQTLTDKTLFTNYAQMLGTPLYMSPEQAQISGLDVDTRSDVYSLGVLLYELLTGTTPFDKERLRAAAYDEMRRIIREEDPPNPSTRLSTMGDAVASVSAMRHTEPRKLSQTLRGELDWIVMKALEKERSRRYETPNGFAGDVERYLKDEPVQACPPSARYRFGKFARRNKGALLTASAVMITLLLAVIGLSVSNGRITREKNQKDSALRGREIALKEKDDALQSAEVSESDARSQETLARRRFYAAQMNLAYRAYEEGEFSRALELIDSQRADPGQAELRSFEWYYLWRLCHRRHLWSKSGHAGLINRIAISPDNRLIATGGEDDCARVWDLRTGKELLKLAAPLSVKRLVFTPDGRTLICGCQDGAVQFWDVRSGTQRQLLKHEHRLSALAVSPDSRNLASSDTHGFVKIWEIDSGREMTTLHEGSNGMRDMRFSHDGRTLTTASWEKDQPSIRVWDWSASPATHKSMWSFPEEPRVVQFSPDGQLVAMTLWGGLRLLDFATGAERFQTTEQRGLVFAVAFSPDGRKLFSAGADKTIQSMNAEVAHAVPPGVAPIAGTTAPTTTTTASDVGSEVIGAHLTSIHSLAISPDGKTLVSGGRDGAVRAWDVEAKNEVTIPQQEFMLRSLYFTADGASLVVASNAGTRLWDAATGRQTAHCAEAIGRAVVSSDGSTLVVTSKFSGILQIWDVARGRQRSSITAHGSAVMGLALSPDGKRLISGAYQDSKIKFWKVGDELTLESVIDRAPRGRSISSLAFSPDGALFAAGMIGSEQLVIFDASGQEKLSLPMAENSVVWQVAFSPDGDLLAAAGEEGILRIWNARTGQSHAVMKGHPAPIRALAFSPDGGTIATGSEDRTVRLWDVATGQERVTFRQHPATIMAVSFAPDGNTLAAGSVDGSVKLWRAAAPHSSLDQAQKQAAAEHPNGRETEQPTSNAAVSSQPAELHGSQKTTRPKAVDDHQR